MNEVVFQVEKHKADNGHEYSTVNILIDNQPLAEIMKAFEMPMAKKEGSPSIAGGYDAIEVPSSPEKYYLGEEEAHWGEDENKTALLDCECGCSGCWPLLCKISTRGNTVYWSDFEQLHRGHDSAASHWDYSEFGGFEFEKSQYLKALEAVNNA